MAPDSRIVKPENLATMAHPRNLEKNAMTQMRMVYPQVTPLSSNPKFVFSPDEAKY